MSLYYNTDELIVLAALVGSFVNQMWFKDVFNILMARVCPSPGHFKQRARHISIKSMRHEGMFRLLTYMFILNETATCQTVS